MGNWWDAAPVVTPPSPSPAAGGGDWWSAAPVVTEAPAAAAPRVWSGQSYIDAAREAGIGVAKGAANTVLGVSRMVHGIPGFSEGMDYLTGEQGRSDASMEEARAAVRPSNPTQSAAMAGEQAAEFFLLPGPAKVKGAARVLEAVKAGVPAAVLAKAQGATGTGAIGTGVMAGLPVGEAVEAGGRYVASKAAPLVRAAIKPTVTAMKRVAGASSEGITAKANQLVNFIIESRVTTADKARTIFQQAEGELQRLLSVKNAPTDAPTRALRYLDALEKSASKQALPAGDVAAIRSAAKEMLEGGLGDSVPVFGPPEPLAGAAGAAAQKTAAAASKPVTIPRAAVEARLKELSSGIDGAIEAPSHFYDEFGRLRTDFEPHELDELWDFVGSKAGKDGLNKGDVLDWVSPQQMATSDMLEGLTYKGRVPTKAEILKAIESKSGRLYGRIVDTARENMLREGADVVEATATAAAAKGIAAQPPKMIRVPREDVSAAEAMERARANAQWSTRKSWGEQKGADKEASKTIERALRDSVKGAVPEAKPLLAREGQALKAAEVLDRMEFRTGNRDAISLPAWAVAGAEVASGKVPLLAAAANWLRNNQLKAGIFADALGKALQRGDTGRVVSILHRLGVGATGASLSSSATVRP